MTTTHEPVREALAQEAKRCAELYASAVAGQQSSGLVPHDTLVKRGADLYAAIDRLASSPAVVAEAGEWVSVPMEPTEAVAVALKACLDDWPSTTWKKAWAAAIQVWSQQESSPAATPSPAMRLCNLGTMES